MATYCYNENGDCEEDHCRCHKNTIVGKAVRTALSTRGRAMLKDIGALQIGRKASVAVKKVISKHTSTNRGLDTK